MSLASYFDELPPRVFYLLSIITRLVLRLVSHLGGRLVMLALPPMRFSCVFSSRSRESMCLPDLSPLSSRLVVSLPRLAVRLGRRSDHRVFA